MTCKRAAWILVVAAGFCGVCLAEAGNTEEKRQELTRREQAAARLQAIGEAMAAYKAEDGEVPVVTEKPAPAKDSNLIAGPVAGRPRRAEEEYRRLARSSNSFAWSLYGRLRAQEGNMFYSPLSLHTALTMTYAGARGQTQERMQGVLRVPEVRGGPPGRDGEMITGFAYWPAARLHKTYAGLLKALTPPKKAKYELRVANALWGQKGYTWRKEFIDITKNSYGAGLREVDFSKAAEAAGKINKWVEQQTKNKIKKLIPPNMLGRDTCLVLTNAIYFLGTWKYQFDKDRTTDLPFKLSADKTVKVPMMRQTAVFGYGEMKHADVLIMPYKGDALSMVIFLPKKLDGLDAVEKRLVARGSGAVPVRLKMQKVKLYLPKFEITWKAEMKKPLKAMGMSYAFESGKADFSGMNGKKDLFISHVLHKAFVDVNEEGTEAAAATAVIMARNGSSRLPPVFRVDHSFIFVIRHNKTGAVLFIGRVTNPKE